ncbi:MAG: hypothetical protein ABGW68_00135, partial [Gammaproteobacteria bacterium]
AIKAHFFASLIPHICNSAKFIVNEFPETATSRHHEHRARGLIFSQLIIMPIGIRDLQRIAKIWRLIPCCMNPNRHRLPISYDQGFRHTSFAEHGHR